MKLNFKNVTTKALNRAGIFIIDGKVILSSDREVLKDGTRHEVEDALTNSGAIFTRYCVRVNSEREGAGNCCCVS